MNFIESEAFKKYRLFLVYSGMWPYDVSMTKWIKRGLCLLNLTLFLLLQIITPFTSEAFFDMLIDLAPVVLMELTIISKFCFCCIKEDHYKTSLEHIKFDWSMLRKSEVPVLKQLYEKSLFYYKILLVFSYVPSAFFIVFQFTPKIADIVVPLNESRPNDFIVSFEYFVDSDKYFYPIVTHMCLTCLLLATAMYSVDMLNFIIQLHMMGMFRLLGFLMEHLFDKPENINSNIDLNSLYYRRVVHIVNLHRRNLKLGDILMRCLLESGMVQLFLGILCISSMLFKLKNLVSAMENVRAVISHCGLLVPYLIIAYLLLSVLQKVSDSSSDMFVKLYFGRWYAAPLKSQKLLLIPMLRYLKPYKFQAKNLIVVNTQTYASIVQAGFSYFMVLYSLQD